MTISNEPCTWAEAEKLFPGVESEWRSMKGAKGSCLPPANIEVRLEIYHYPQKPALRVIQIDHENKWHYPPEWFYWGSGNWTHPIPLPKLLLWTYEYETT